MNLCSCLSKRLNQEQIILLFLNGLKLGWQGIVLGAAVLMPWETSCGNFLNNPPMSKKLF